MYVRFAVYLDDLDLENLKHQLSSKGLNPSISYLFRKWTRAYLDRSGYTSSTEEITNAPDNHELQVSIHPSIKKTENIVKKVQKAEYCPHLIMVGGNCGKCGGIAR